MKKTDLLPYVSHVLDDALSRRAPDALPTDLSRVRMVAYQCGFEPLVVAVVSYLPGVTVDACNAEEIASDWLHEIGWLDDDSEADYVL